MLTPRTSDRASLRGGNVLVFFALMVFVAMAVAALVIDMGFSRLTQHEMQTAAETAALEGLRYRDDLPAAWRPNGTTAPNLPAALVAHCGPQPSATYDPTNPAWQEWCDCARRYAASTTVSLSFDDDLNPADGDTLQLGAGPVVNVTNTLGGPELQAGGIVTPEGEPPVYKPSLQSNPSNVTGGDLVAGQYGYNASFNPTDTYDEDSSYNRRDFLPDSPSGTVPETGFLARLRRSNEDFSAASGVASNGPTLPIIFGRGSMLPRFSSDPSDFTVASGITVRATAIAAAGSVTLPAQGTAASTTVQMGHVLVVGPVDPTNLITGVAPFGLTATYWNSLVNPAKTGPGTDTATVTPATGIITSTLVPPGGGTTNPNLTEAGVTGVTQAIVEAVGQVYAAAGSDAPLAQSPTLYLYVPIYDTIGTTARTIVGFGYVKWSYTGGTLSLTVPWNTTTNLPRDHIASENATASLVVPWPATITGSTSAAALIQSIFTENQGLSGALLAPVIASHYFGPSTVP